MKELNRQLSEKTEKIVQNIFKNLPKPVKFYPIDENMSGFGCCDQTELIYRVFLNYSLPNEAFEINLIHELIHLTQMTKNIPDARQVNLKDEREKNFAASINSLILDLEVENKLVSYGFNTHYFSNIRLKQMEEVRKEGFPNYEQNFLYQKYNAVRLALYAYVATEEVANKMFDVFADKYPMINEIAKIIIKIIEGRKFETTREMFDVMKQIIELLDISQHIVIVYNDKLFYYYNRNWNSKYLSA